MYLFILFGLQKFIVDEKSAGTSEEPEGASSSASTSDLEASIESVRQFLAQKLHFLGKDESDAAKVKVQLYYNF